MDWSQGFVSSYSAYIVDPKTWRDTSSFEITGGSVKNSNTSMRASSTVDTTEFPQDKEYWIRIYLEAHQESEVARVALFTGVVSAPSKNITGSHRKVSLQCYSVLKPAEDMLLPLGWYVLKGTDGAQIIRELLKVTNAPIKIEGKSPTLSSTIIAENGETNMTIIDKILDAIEWCLKISGDGSITICPKSDSYYVIMDEDDYDIVEMSIDEEFNWYDCPNALRVTDDGLTAVYKDEDPKSMLSIQNRGREIWTEEESVTLKDNETLSEYAVRRLKELQKVSKNLSYSRRFIPGLFPSDLIGINYPSQGVSGVYRIKSQTIELNYSARTSEEVELA